MTSGALESKEIQWQALISALLTLIPICIGYLITKNLMFFDVGLISISLLIARDQLQLSVPWITVHYLAIILSFTLLYFSFPYFEFFVPLVSSMAFGTIYSTRFGTNFRKISNYTFIPAVYLSCELQSSISNATEDALSYAHFITLSFIAYISVCVLSLFDGKPPSKTIYRGESPQTWLPAAISIFFATGLAAAYVLFFHIQKGEWMIWSAASVITIDPQSSKTKLGQRTLGIIFGIPLGLSVAYFLPKIPLMYSLMMIGVMLTLVAFKRYIIAFTLRCSFVAAAAYLMTSTAEIAIDRIENVLAGGLIGIACFYLFNGIMRKSWKKPH